MNTQTQIRFIATVERPDWQEQPPGNQSIQINVTCTQGGIDVAVNDTVRPTISWEDVGDMEKVSDTYWMLRVWEFRALVPLLGQASLFWASEFG